MTSTETKLTKQLLIEMNCVVRSTKLNAAVSLILTR
jgi:hypothetical protein